MTKIKKTTATRVAHDKKVAQTVLEATTRTSSARNQAEEAVLMAVDPQMGRAAAAHISASRKSAGHRDGRKKLTAARALLAEKLQSQLVSGAILLVGVSDDVDESSVEPEPVDENPVLAAGPEQSATTTTSLNDIDLIEMAGGGGVGQTLLVEGAYEQKFVADLLSQYLSRFREIRDAMPNQRLDDLLGLPDALAERVLASTPLTPSPMEELTGPFYDTPGLRKWLRVSRQALDGRARTHSLLALTTGDGSRVYPAWQFTPEGGVIPHLGEVFRALAYGIEDPWTHALWLTAPNEDWADPQTGEPLTAWQWLAKRYDPEPVLFEARADAARWAS